MTSPATLHHSYLYSNTLSHSMKRSNQWRNHLSQRTQHQPLSILHRLLLFKPILLIPTTTSLHPSSFFPSNTSYSSILPPSINTLYSIINPSLSNYSTITILLHPFYHYYWNTRTWTPLDCGSICWTKRVCMGRVYRLIQERQCREYVEGVWTVNTIPQWGFTSTTCEYDLFRDSGW